MQSAFITYWSNDTILLLIFFSAILLFPIPQLVSDRLVKRTTAIIAMLFLGAMLYEAAGYITMPNYIDYAEPMVTTMATNFLNGGKLYHDWKDGIIIGSLYGPLTFLAQVPFLTITPSIAASKLPGVLCFIVSLSIMWLSLGCKLSGSIRLILIALVASFVAQFDDMWYWNRPDPYLILLSALAVFVVRRLRAKDAVLILGIIVGLGANFKLHAPLYIAPLAVGIWFAMRADKRRILFVGMSVGLAAIAFALPLLLSETSLSLYLANVLVATRHGLSANLFLHSAAFAGALSLPPLALSCFSLRSEVTPAALGLAAASLTVALLSAKPGSGTPHLMPFAPISVSLIALALETQRPGDLRRVCTLVLCSTILISPVWIYNWWKRGQLIGDVVTERMMGDEARRLFAEYPGSEMGVGTSINSPALKLRVVSGLEGHRVVFDPVNWADLRFAGEPVSLLTSLLSSCRIRSWILPRSEALFAASSFGVSLFDATFRRKFIENYYLKQSGQFYDVWLCAAQHRPEASSE